jgi:DNA-binding transcriptional LysR family regulator
MFAAAPQGLSLWLHLAGRLHFARTAKAFHMSPSALTRSIQRSEELGHSLFQRTEIAPTPISRSRERVPSSTAEVDGNEAILAMVALGCGVGVVPALVRKDSPLCGRIEQVEVKRPPRGYHVALRAKAQTLARRTASALWELAPETASR